MPYMFFVVIYLPSVLVVFSVVLLSLRWGVFFFGWGSWLIGLRFVFSAWGGSLGAGVRADDCACVLGWQWAFSSHSGPWPRGPRT